MFHDSNSTQGKKLVLAIIIAVFFVVAYFLQLIFSGRLILPQTFRLGPLVVHYYGLIMALAVASGFYLAIKRAPKFGLTIKQAEDILFWVIISGFLGARLYHVLSSIGYYSQHPIDVLKVWNGGLSIYGAVFGGLIAVWFFATSYKLQATSLFDWLTPSVILGQIIGRFGNLFNYEAFGYPTNLPWKMFVPEMFRPLQYVQAAFFHPWFLYEALGNLIVLILLLTLEKRRKLFPGALFFFYLLLYNSLRLALEFLRIDSTFLGAVRLNAAVSLFLVLISLGCLFYIYASEHPKTS